MKRKSPPGESPGGREMCIRDRLSVEQRVQYIQQAYERTKDKTDILMPRSAADIKAILENGKIEFDWPDAVSYTHLDVYTRQVQH